jgi:hypothetical protein
MTNINAPIDPVRGPGFSTPNHPMTNQLTDTISQVELAG